MYAFRVQWARNAPRLALVKRLMLAAIFAAATLCGLADRLPGAMIAFTGVIDDVQADVTPALFMVGDIFSATLSFNYHPHPEFGGGGIVSEYLIMVGDLTLSGTIPTGSHIGADLVAFDTDPSHGSVFYELIQFHVSRPTFFASSDIVLQAATPNGVIPPLDQFNLNQFLVQLAFKNPPQDPPKMQLATGHLTSLPTISGLVVADSGASVTLFSCALLGMAALGRCFRPGRKSRLGTA
jgi:hypothetical protein